MRERLRVLRDPIVRGCDRFSADCGGRRRQQPNSRGNVYRSWLQPQLATPSLNAASVPDHLLDRLPITTPAQRIVRLVIKGNVEHRTEIQIKTEQTQQMPGDVAMLANQPRRLLVAQLLGIGRFVSNLVATAKRDRLPDRW